MYGRVPRRLDQGDLPRSCALASPLSIAAMQHYLICCACGSHIVLEYPGHDVWAIMAHGRTREAGFLAEVAESCPGRKRGGGSDGGGVAACGHAVFHCDSGCVAEHWEMGWRCWTCDAWQRGGGPGWMGCVGCGEKRPPGVEMVWRRAGWVESEDQDSEQGDGDYVVLESSDDGEEGSGGEEEEEGKRDEKRDRGGGQ